MTVAAVVVTHNRQDVLRRCLSALEGQTRRVDEIVVIDNCSTDGTAAMVAREFPAVSLVRSPRNTGGAGGFALGMDVVIGRGHEFAWLLDDDAEPRPTALAPLLTAMEATAPERPGFVASTVVKPDGEILQPHRPPRIGEGLNGRVRAPAGTYPAAYSTFCGALVDLAAARTTYLPVADFFIWWDDYEYTGRLQALRGGLASTESIIVHPERPATYDSGWRLRADIRNRLWIIRHRGLASPAVRASARFRFWAMIGDQARYSASKTLFLRCVVLGLVEGLLRRPRMVMPSGSPTPDRHVPAPPAA